MMFNTFIFDLDGTIADTLPLCIAAFKQSISPLLQADISEDEIVATFGPSEEGTIKRLIPQQQEAGIEAYLQKYAELHYTCADPFEGIKELLEFLQSRNVQLAMVTGKGIHSTRISLQQFGLAQYFTILETGSPDGPNKVQGIQNVLSRLNADKQRSLYIGDAPSDILYCQQAGIPIASAAWAPKTDAEKLKALHPDYLFYTISDFSDWVKKQI